MTDREKVKQMLSNDVLIRESIEKHQGSATRPIKKTEVALGVRVRLRDSFEPSSLGESYLMCEKYLFIGEASVYNDSLGDWVFVKGGSLCNSAAVYLKDLELEFPTPDNPIYPHEAIDYSTSKLKL